MQSRKSRLYVSGALHIIGIAFFIVFLLASSDIISIPVMYKRAFGLLGLVLWIIGFAWALTLRNHKQN